MSLTVGGFAPQRMVPLRGKGGNRGWRDNGVLPPAPLATDASSAPLATSAPATTDTPSAYDAPRARNAPPAEGVPFAPSAPRVAARRRPRGKLMPAALEWQDARLPIVGRLWATAWLPSILLAGCLVALMYLLQTSSVATTGYDIQHFQAERDAWQLRNEQLQLELDKRQSLTWIEAEATTRLGMVRAQPTALAYLKVAR